MPSELDNGDMSSLYHAPIMPDNSGGLVHVTEKELLFDQIAGVAWMLMGLSGGVLS